MSQINTRAPSRVFRGSRPLTREEQQAFLDAGYSLVFRGSHITRAEDLPSLAELAAAAPETAQQSAAVAQRRLDALQAEQEQLKAFLRNAKDPKTDEPLHPADHPALAPRPPWDGGEPEPPPGAPRFRPPSPFGARPEGAPPGMTAPRLTGDPMVEGGPAPPEEEEDPATKTTQQGDTAPAPTGAQVGSIQERPEGGPSPDPQAAPAPPAGPGRVAETGTGPRPRK